MLTTIEVTEDCIRYAGSDVVMNSMQFYRTNSAVAQAIKKALRPNVHVMVGRSRVDIFDGSGPINRIYWDDEQRQVVESDVNNTLTAPVSFQLDIREDFLKS